jgi:hypothetical protein
MGDESLLSVGVVAPTVMEALAVSITFVGATARRSSQSESESLSESPPVILLSRRSDERTVCSRLDSRRAVDT